MFREMVMGKLNILPDHEALRRAVRWLSEEASIGGVIDGRKVDEAANRFDLSPLEEEFLLRHFRSTAQHGAAD